jgi:predicted nucleotidyltransferase
LETRPVRRVTSVTLAELREYRGQIEAIAAEHGVVAIRVFGSVARGDAGERSDVDLLVELEQGRGLFDLGAFLTEVQELVGQPVDVVTPKGLRSRIRDQVIQEAVAL